MRETGLRMGHARRAAVIWLALLVGAPAVAGEIWSWDVELDEAQVRNGPAHDGSTDSPGWARAHLELDPESRELYAVVEWGGLVGSLRKLHVHGPAEPGRNNSRHVIELIGPPGPTPDQARTEGRFEVRTRLEPFAHGMHRAMEPADVVRVLESGRAYLNLHSSVFPKGELRGNLGAPARGETRAAGAAD